MKVIICGGRDFDNYPFMCDKLDAIFSNNKPDEIVSGGQKTVEKDENGVVVKVYGADALGELYAWDHYAFGKHKCKVTVFEANWYPNGKLDRSAGPKRNQQMADYATHCVAFWNGRSKGTQDMILRAKANGLNVRVVFY